MNYNEYISLNSQLSVNERRMFMDLGWTHLIYAPLSIMPFYQMAIERAFIKNQKGPAVEALRRAAKHFADGAYRGNKNFEDLISY